MQTQLSPPCLRSFCSSPFTFSPSPSTPAGTPQGRTGPGSHGWVLLQRHEVHGGEEAGEGLPTAAQGCLYSLTVSLGDLSFPFRQTSRGRHRPRGRGQGRWLRFLRPVAIALFIPWDFGRCF